MSRHLDELEQRLDRLEKAIERLRRGQASLIEHLHPTGPPFDCDDEDWTYERPHSK